MDNVLEKFSDNFIKLNTPLVIYGLSEMTKKIIEEYPDKIVGLLDGYKSSGEIYGKPILSLDSLKGQNIAILIVARCASEKIIYRNIAKFCRENKIDIYSLSGKVNDEIIKSDFDIEYDKNNIVKREVEECILKNKFFDFGYKNLAPLLTGFTMWFIDKVKNADKVLFISRDGFLMKKIYDEIAKKINLPKSEYVYTSRNFALMCSIENEKDIEYVKSFPFHGKESEMLEKRFYLKGADCTNELVLAKARALRENYKKYLSKFNITNNTCIFDFVSTGTVQMCLEKILGVTLKGIYFQKIDTYDKRKENLVINGFVNENLPDYECDNYFLLEPLIKEPKPSLKFIDSNENIVFDDTNTINNDICEIQNGVEEFIKRLVGKDDFYIDKKAINYALHKLVTIDTKIDFPITNFDVFTNREIIIKGDN
ncbi:MAG: hypothetical protein IJS47_00440 [Clostridia bacterium]|nr:hypothetical protein [Clostridia bacterium]